MLAEVENATVTDCIFIFLAEDGNKKQEDHFFSLLSISWVPGETGMWEGS